MQPAGFEQRHHAPDAGVRLRSRSRSCSMMPAIPSGLNSTTAMNSSPYHSSQVSVYTEQIARDDEKDRADHRAPEADQPASISTIITT